MDDKPMSLMEHLQDLRRVLIISILSIIPTSVVGWYYRDFILDFLTKPITKAGQKLVYFGLTEGFFVQLKLSLIAGVILAMPIIIWQIWGFILPALKTNEKRALMYLVPTSFILFIGGVAFAYYAVFPVGVRFFLTYLGFGGEYAQPMLSLSRYLSFTAYFLLAFGLIFELPLVILFLSKLGLVTPKFLRKQRKFAILLIFVVAAALTPGPDVVSQLMMAVPLYILYEVSIILSMFTYRKKKAAEEAIFEVKPEEVQEKDENNRERNREIMREAEGKEGE